MGEFGVAGALLIPQTWMAGVCGVGKKGSNSKAFLITMNRCRRRDVVLDPRTAGFRGSRSPGCS